MTIHAISHASVALYITPTDLLEHGLTPGTLTLERALTLARDAFAEAGVEPEGSMEIDAFPDACGVLIFARVKPPEEIFFSFSDSDALIRAVQVLPALPGESALNWWDGMYWLSIPGGDPRAAAILSEFGQQRTCCPCLSGRITEYGRALLRGDVIGTLKKYFVQ